mgnify:CR=1 FL=1
MMIVLSQLLGDNANVDCGRPDNENGDNGYSNKKDIYNRDSDSGDDGVMMMMIMVMVMFIMMMG